MACQDLPENGPDGIRRPGPRRIIKSLFDQTINDRESPKQKHSFDPGHLTWRSMRMKLSHRITTLNDSGSDGWDLYRRAQEMTATGHDITDLTIGEHDRRTDPSILEAMNASARGGHTGYATLPGTDGFRDTIATRVTGRTGVPTSRDNIIVTAGGQAALFAAVSAACDPGETALYIDPFYVTYPGTIRGTGAVAHAVRAQASADFQPDAVDIDAAARATDAKALLVNSPNNPTGVVYSDETLTGIVNTARARDLWLISDEVYETQVWDGTHLSLRPLAPERTLVIGSMSKGHAMTGSRLGWVLGPEDAIAAIGEFTLNTTYGVPGFIQDAAEFALNRGSAFENEIAAPFRRRHTRARGYLEHSGLHVVPSAATMYLMVDIRPTGLDGEAFALQLLETAKVAVMPGESFGHAAAGHVRIALTVEDSRLMSALTALCDTYATLKQDAA